MSLPGGAAVSGCVQSAQSALCAVELVQASWRRLSDRLGRLHSQLEPFAALLDLPVLVDDPALRALHTATADVLALAAAYVDAPPAQHAALQKRDQQKARELHGRIDALMTDVAVKLNAVGLQRREQQRQTRNDRQQEWKEGGVPLQAEAQAEMALLLELMRQVVLERAEGTERRTLRQLEELRRRTGLVNEPRHLAERETARPLAERLQGFPIISHTELELSTSKRSGQLGKGGFGRVVKGRWLRHGRLEVAVKLPMRLAEDGLERARFEDELVLLHRLRGTLHIVPVLAVCLEAGHEAIVMPLLREGDLYTRLQAARKDPGKRGLSWERKVALAMDIVRGVNALHLLPPPFGPVLHRDLKSLNVLLDEHERACISDFGLSRVEHRVDDGDFFTFAPSELTGTVHWRAPEQQLPGQKRKYNARCDVFSIGMLLWELATEQPPFGSVAHSKVHVGELIFRGVRPAIPSEVPAYFHRWITQCWAQDAEQRPLCSPLLNDMQEVAESLKAARPPPEQPRLNDLGPLLPPSIAAPLPAALPAPIRTSQAPLPGDARVTGPIPRGSPPPRPPRPQRVALPPPPSAPRASLPPPFPAAGAALSLPPRMRSGRVAEFRGVFHECGRNVGVRLRLRFLSAFSPPNSVLGEGEHRGLGRFDLFGGFSVGDDGGWKLRLRAAMLIDGRSVRTFKVSSTKAEQLHFSGRWKADGPIVAGGMHSAAAASVSMACSDTSVCAVDATTERAKAAAKMMVELVEVMEGEGTSNAHRRAAAIVG